MFATAAQTLPHRDAPCECIVCRTRRPFEMPEQLVHACIEGDLVVFAGAGISTEGPTVLPFTFYDHICGELGIGSSEGLSFASLMSRFEAARGRIALLTAIKERLGYVRSFPAIDGQAGAFHDELAGIFTVTDIVTTNWDEYFEQRCGAQPFVTDADWAYAKSATRRVFKLHGSILNPGSIVATEADYERCYHELNEGLVGAKLKELLATKTVVFVGYSLRDSDFVRLYQLIKARMGEILPRSYVVTVGDDEPPDVAGDMHVIRTNGIHFLQELKAEFDDGEILANERFDAIPLMRAIVSRVHEHLVGQGEIRDDPAMLMCACYHDGLLDAFGHIQANKQKGDYFHRCYTQRVAGTTYEELRREREEDGRWLSVAYIEGYQNGLSFLIADDATRSKMPLYYVAGCTDEMRTYEQYQEAARYFKTLNRAAFERAKAEASRLAPGVVFQHLPSLL